MGVVVLAGAAVVAIVLVSDRDAVAPTASVATTVVVEPTSPREVAPDVTGISSGARSGAVELREVWLVRQGDGSYDWGVTIGSAAAVDRGPIEVVATLLDEAGQVVATEQESVRRLAAGSAAAVGGEVTDPDGTPDRVEVDVSQGEELASAAPAPEQVEAVSGRLRSSADDVLEDLRLALLWRDGRGEVLASLFEPIARVRPGIDARFEVPLPDEFVGEGPPDDVSWSYGPSTD